MFGTSTFKRVLYIALFVMKKILANLVLNRIFVTDKTAACFFLGGYLRNRGRILLQCKIECCSVDNCNTQIPTLSQDAVTVFSPNGNGTFNQRMTLHINSKLCNAPPTPAMKDRAHHQEGPQQVFRDPEFPLFEARD